MVDTTLYIQQLTYELRKKSQRIIELCKENARLNLQNGSLQKENEQLKYELERRKHETTINI